MILRIRLHVLLGLIAFAVCGCGGDGPRGDWELVADNTTDTIWVRILFNAGSAFDPVGKEGLAFATATNLSGGYDSPQSSEFRARLHALPAQLTTWVDREISGFDFSCPREVWPELSEFIVSALSRPQLDGEELARLIGHQLEALAELRHDDALAARAVLQKRLYGEHRYAHPPEGSDHSVLDLTIADLESFWESHYTDSNLYLGLAGAISGVQAQEFRTALTTALPFGGVRSIEAPEINTQGLELSIVEMPGGGPRTLLLGTPNPIVRGDPDFPMLYLANACIGRHGGLLSKQLDEIRDMSFVAWSHAEHTEAYDETDILTTGRTRAAQYLAVEAQPDATNLAFVLNLILAELEDHTAQVLPQREISAAASDIRILARTANLHPAHRMHTRVDARRLGIAEFSDSLAHSLDSLDVREMRRVLRMTIDPKNIVVVAVAPKGQSLVQQLLRHQITYRYPAEIDQHALRPDDMAYLSYRPQWDPGKMRILKADELFR